MQASLRGSARPADLSERMPRELLHFGTSDVVKEVLSSISPPVTSTSLTYSPHFYDLGFKGLHPFGCSVYQVSKRA